MEQLSALMGGEPRPDLVDRILARSDGNPFYVEELVRAGATDGQDLPSVLRDVLGVRISALSRPARDILRAAAAAGRRIDDELLAAATAVSPPELAGALREAVDAGILVRSGSGDAATSTFRHALLQEVVDGELFPAERTALHAAFARALEARAATDGPSASPAELARHWDAAGEPARALGPMVDAARAAEQVYAWPEALRLWERARELFERVPRAVDVVGSPAVELTARAAECALLAGDYGRAVTLGRAAVEGIDERSDPTAAGDLHTRLRWYLWEAGDRAGAAWAVEEALRLIPASPPSRARARALAHQAGVLMFAGRYEASIRAASEAIEMGRTTGAVREAALALGILGWDLAATGDVEGGLARFLEGRRVAESLGRAEGIALAITNHVALLDRIGRSEDALAAARQGYAEIRRLGVARTYGGVLLGYAAKAELALGRWDDAARSTSQGLRAGGSDRAELWLLVQRGRLLTWRGAFAEAAVLLGRARSIVDRQPASEFATALLEAEGELAAEQGDLASLHRVAAAGLAMLASGAPADPPLARLATVVVRGEADARALADVAPGRRDEAGATVIEQVDAAIRAALGAGSLAAGARGAVILAQLDAERGRLAGRTDVDAWRAVAEGWAAAGRPYPTAFARFREAEATLAAGGGRSDAVAMLRDARAVAVALGAAPLRERIDRLARAARLVVEEDAPQPAADPFGFTARELEVLPLLAAGWTNQQIGDALFITRKTASVHVSNIMAKLDVEHRAEAAATAHRLGLVRGGPIGR
jgi:DNA-binding CsgD family transcriptional regulator/tetratricopeptide (TPR) repeat protein